jgi:hypothetical protein
VEVDEIDPEVKAARESPPSMRATKTCPRLRDRDVERIEAAVEDVTGDLAAFGTR